MSLLGALNIGRNAIAAQQAAIQVTSNNIANAGNANYTRQTAVLTSRGDQRAGPGLFLGRGVTLSSVNRQIDNALSSRLRGANSDASGAAAGHEWIAQVESVFDALGKNGISSGLSTFFNDWSRVASNPVDIGLRQIALTDGASVAATFRDTRKQLVGVRNDIDTRIAGSVTSANDIAGQIADLNGQITVTEGGSGGGANALRDQRDGLLRDLSGLVDISVHEDGSSVNVFIGSQPLVSGTISRGLATKQAADSAGELQTTLVFKKDGAAAQPTSGSIGGLIATRQETASAITKVDGLATSLISELNRLHSSGQGLTGLTAVTGANAVSSASAPLSAAGLKFQPGNGSFVVTVTEKATGLTTSKLIKIDPNTTSLNDIAAQLGDSSISATISGGKLSIKTTSPDITLGFSQDSSGALAALGINTFFTGSNASDIAVNSDLAGNPALLAVAGNNNKGNNTVALAIAALEKKPIGGLGNLTISQSYDGLVTGIAAKTSAARTVAEGSTVVLDTLQNQRESLSGVSLDEESINLIQQQKAFEGAARVISTVNDLLDTVLNLVR